MLNLYLSATTQYGDDIKDFLSSEPGSQKVYFEDFYRISRESQFALSNFKEQITGGFALFRSIF